MHIHHPDLQRNVQTHVQQLAWNKDYAPLKGYKSSEYHRLHTSLYLQVRWYAHKVYQPTSHVNPLDAMLSDNGHCRMYQNVSEVPCFSKYPLMVQTYHSP